MPPFEPGKPQAAQPADSASTAPSKDVVPFLFGSRLQKKWKLSEPSVDGKLWQESYCEALPHNDRPQLSCNNADPGSACNTARVTDGISVSDDSTVKQDRAN